MATPLSHHPPLHQKSTTSPSTRVLRSIAPEHLLTRELKIVNINIWLVANLMEPPTGNPQQRHDVVGGGKSSEIWRLEWIPPTLSHESFICGFL